MRTLSLIALLLVLPLGARAATLRVHADVAQRGLEPVLLEVTVSAGGETLSQSGESPLELVFEDLVDGEAALAVSAPGFDAVSLDLALWGTRDLAVTLFPAADVSLSGQVEAVRGPVQGVRVRVEGERSPAPLEGLVEADGSFAIHDIPAGYYDISLEGAEGARILRQRVDLLADTEISFVIPDISESPGIERERLASCSTSPGAGTSLFGAALILLGLALRRRSS